MDERSKNYSIELGLVISYKEIHYGSQHDFK